MLAQEGIKIIVRVRFGFYAIDFFFFFLFFFYILILRADLNALMNGNENDFFPIFC